MSEQGGLRRSPPSDLSSAEHQDVELRTLRSDEHSRHEDGQEFSLPQADGGKDAWMFLIAAFFVEALVWGKFVYDFPCNFIKFHIFALPESLLFGVSSICVKI